MAGVERVTSMAKVRGDETEARRVLLDKRGLLGNWTERIEQATGPAKRKRQEQQMKE